MMWNQNDTKYIIKRLILYIAISCIVFFGAQSCAKASVVSRYQCDSSNNTSCDFSWSHSNYGTAVYLDIYNMGNSNKFQNYGQGYINFSLIAWAYGGQYNLPIYEIDIVNGNNTALYVCDIGTYTQYYDNNNNYIVYSVKCPVNMDSNGIGAIKVSKYSGDVDLHLKRSEIITWSSTESDANAINSSAQSIAQSQMANDNANANAIMAEINRDMYGVQARLDQYGVQQHADSQAETNAINSVNSSIQAQTNWQQQDFNSDTTQIDAITDLISTGDKNKIRDLMMFPARILMLIGAHIGSDYCTPYNLGSLYGTNLILPCINWKNYVGVGLYNTIDTIISIGIYIGLIIYVRKLLDYAFSLGATTFESVNVEVFN